MVAAPPRAQQQHAARGWRSLVEALRDPARSEFAFVPHQYVHAPAELVDVSLSPGESTPINARKDFTERSSPYQLNRFFVLHVVAIGVSAMCCAWVALFPISATRLYNMQVDVFNTNHVHATYFFNECLYLGQILGAAAAGYLGDRLGRAGALELAAIPYIVGWLLVGLAYGEITVIIGRYLLGMATGMMSVVAPIYLAEVSAARTRGRVLCVQALCAALGSACYVAIGVLCIYLSRAYFGFNLSEWKVLAMVGLTPGLVLLLAMQKLPDSPTWLVMRHDDRETAFEILAKLFNGSYKNAEYHVNAIIHANLLASKHQDRMHSRVVLLLRPLALCCVLFTLRAFASSLVEPTLSATSKTNAFMVTLFGIDVDGTETELLIAMTCMWIAACIGVLCCFLLIDVRGRLLALRFGCYVVVCGCAFIMLSAYRSNKTDGQLTDYGSATMMLILAGHELGLGVVPVVVASELFPVRLRVGAMSLVVVWDRAVRLGLASYVVPFLRANLHSLHVFWLGAGLVLLCNVGGIVVSWFYLPETSKRSLQEIEAILSGWQPATPQLGFSRVRLGGLRYGTSFSHSA
uniref:Hexose transporter 1 n=1 Tax=Globisporangium ultimum (strain ATCC 200006 / CBS 805.95 / DAOM BR144) TaxID=431595 RepID=K3WUA9_GLOUD